MFGWANPSSQGLTKRLNSAFSRAVTKSALANSEHMLEPPDAQTQASGAPQALT